MAPTPTAGLPQRTDAGSASDDLQPVAAALAACALLPALAAAAPYRVCDLSVVSGPSPFAGGCPGDPFDAAHNAAHTLAAPQAGDGPTDVFLARIARARRRSPNASSRPEPRPRAASLLPAAQPFPATRGRPGWTGARGPGRFERG
jgi:hypothetical protein